MDPKSVHAQFDAFEIIDVREPREWRAGHIPGAKHIPMREIPARLAELGRSDGPIVAVCRSGNRSAQVERYLTAQGLKVHNLDGGMKAWAKAGLPVASADGAAGKVV